MYMYAQKPPALPSAAEGHCGDRSRRPDVARAPTAAQPFWVDMRRAHMMAGNDGLWGEVTPDALPFAICLKPWTNACQAALNSHDLDAASNGLHDHMRCEQCNILPSCAQTTPMGQGPCFMPKQLVQPEDKGSAVDLGAQPTGADVCSSHRVTGMYAI